MRTKENVQAMQLLFQELFYVVYNLFNLFNLFNLSNLFNY